MILYMFTFIYDVSQHSKNKYFLINTPFLQPFLSSYQNMLCESFIDILHLNCRRFQNLFRGLMCHFLFHHFFSRLFGFFSILGIACLLNVFPAFWGKIFPDDLEGLIGIIGGDGGSGLFSLDHNLNELLLVLSGAVIREPIIQIFPTDPPTVLHSLGAVKCHALDIRDHDGFGCRQREVVLFDYEQFLVDCYLVVVVQNF